MNRCFIFGAGPFFGLPLSPTEEDFLIAADGGLEWCRQENLTPALLLGDFDSLSPDSLTAFPWTVETFPVEKDDTDMMLAVKAGLARGCREFHLYGGLGGRLDHTLANLQTLLYIARHQGRGYLYGEDWIYTAVENGTFSLPDAPKDTLFSVFCLGADAKGVSIRGAKYPLDHVVLTAAFPLGVSNRFLSGPAEVEVLEGALLVGWERK